MSRGLIRDDVTDTAGGALQGVQVSIYTAGTLTLATVYNASEGGTAISNPLTTDNLGVFECYAATGEYDLKIEAPGGDINIYNVPAFDGDSVNALEAAVAAAQAAQASAEATLESKTETHYTVLAGATVVTVAEYTVGDGTRDYELESNPLFIGLGEITETNATTVTLATAPVGDATLTVIQRPSRDIGTAAASNVSATQGNLQSWMDDVDNHLVINVKDYGAVGDGVTDDSAAIQAAITAAGEGIVEFPYATYLCGDLIVEDFIDLTLIGNGSTLKATPTCSRIIWFQRNVGRAAAPSMSDFIIDGDNVAGVIGLQAGTHDDDAGHTPGAILYRSFSNILSTRCEVAFYLPVMMESTLEKCVAQHSTCGFWLETSPIGGGCNGNFFDGCSAYVCDLGFFIDNRANNFGVANNIFSALVLQGNKLAFASINATRSSMNGFYFEANGASAVTFDGFAFPKCVGYFDNSAFEATAMNVAETVTPGIWMTNGSTASIGVFGGYGTNGEVFYADSDEETVFFESSYTALGQANIKATQWPCFAAPVMDSSHGIMGIPDSILDETLPNDYVWTHPSTPALLSPQAPATVTGTVYDSDQGFASEAVFGASVGSSGANRVSIPTWSTVMAANDYMGVSLMVKSDIAGKFTFVGAPAGNAQGTFNIGTEWTRIVLLGRWPAGGSGSNLYIYPADAVGATVKFAKIHSYSTASKVLHQDYGTRIMQGFWSAGTKREVWAAAVPAVGTWKVGDRVYNTAPAVDGNNMVLDHWICTVAGTPGTWVAQHLSTVSPAT